MASIRILFLWHMHQPFYKDLVSGEYRLPWVRLHALKDYYGMVKLLEEFSGVHQTFNLVPSLITQIDDYVSGAASDHFLRVMAKQREILAAVLPAYRKSALSGAIEISTSPFYHPILPLLCDTDVGRISSPGLPLSAEKFCHPADAKEHLRRGFELHERVFGLR